MFSFVGHPQVWNQTALQPNAQYVYAYPTAYVIQAPTMVQSNAYTRDRGVDNSAWRGAAAVQPSVQDNLNAPTNREPIYSINGPVTPRHQSDSSDDVFFAADDIDTPRAVPAFNKTPRNTTGYDKRGFSKTNGMLARRHLEASYMPKTPGIRLPGRYRHMEQPALSTKQYRENNARRCNGFANFMNRSLDVSGELTTSSHSTGAWSADNSGTNFSPNTSSGVRSGNSSRSIDLKLEDLSSVMRTTAGSMSCSDENASTSPPQLFNKQRNRSEMSSLSSCILPMSLRAAINEDPPEPTRYTRANNTVAKPVTPLKTSSPIREDDDFLALPSRMPTASSKALKQSLKKLPTPLGSDSPPRRLTRTLTSITARHQNLTYQANQILEDIESVSSDIKNRKRRVGRCIVGNGFSNAINTKRTTRERYHSAEKFPRVSGETLERKSTVRRERREDKENQQLRRPENAKVYPYSEDESGSEENLDQCALILRQQNEAGAAEEQARKREEFLLILEAERERQRRLVLPKKAPKMSCKFCRNNGEDEEVYTKHRLHDRERTVCPILRHYVCRLCNSSGDFAHTIKHCPFNNRKDRLAWKATFLM